MIYTITLNPALDYFMDYSKEGEVKKWARTDNAKLQYGGKGINASILLKNIQAKSVALVLSGGHTGKILLDSLKQEGITYKNFDTFSDVRINVKARFDDTYEFLTGSLNKNENITNEILKYLEENIKPEDVVMIMGSKMDGLPEDIIDQISILVHEKQGELIYDLSGPELLQYAKYKPLVIKPNLKELSDIFETSITSNEDIKKYADKFIELGVKNIIVSQDDKGASVFSKDTSYETMPLSINLVNGAGAGDSMIAGFTAATLGGESIENALDFANACGAGTASVVGITDRHTIANLYNGLLKLKGEQNA